ncbi:MAG TPA: hypothetical protein VGP80_09420 [Gemmatimonadales bacterium]|jgi:hypothetical protein|nr:hypothetical protein [Gemmatimonadales bacterium]
MRSPADRRILELLLRAAGLAGLVWLIAGSFMSHRPAGRVSLATRWPMSLPEWSLNPPADSLTVRLAAIPERPALDWLVALRRAGTHVTWSGAGLTALAIEVEPRGDPAGGVLVRAGGVPDRTLALRDRLGALDSLRLGRVGGTAIVPAAEGVVAATIRTGESVTAAVGAGDTLRRILVLGTAGWESKFVVAALSERGWMVDARLAVAPRLTVLAGTPTTIDTSVYTAVIALDSTAAPQADAITRYVHSGGGLILAPDAVGLRAFRSLLPAGPGRAVAPSGLPVERVTSRAELPIRDLAPLQPNAVALERVNGHLVAAAGRAGSGRVLALGLGETWRWRMEGDESAMAAHRSWWAANVAAVAYVPVPRGKEATDPAPLASLYQSLGSPVNAGSGANPGNSLSWVVLLGVMASLLGEWASRRLRGTA